jgi:hypothetical protein
VKIDRLEQPCIGRHFVACMQQNHITRDELARRNLDFLAIAYDGHRGRGHLAERFDRAFRPVLLNEAQHHSEEHDHGDGDGLDALSENGGDRRGDQQNDDQDVLELLEKDGPRGDTTRRLQLVRSISSDSTLHLGLRQSVRGGLQMRHGRVDRQRVPFGRGFVG